MATPRLARRLDHIQPFYVMEVAKAARQVAQTAACDPAQGGTPMIYLNIGEPDVGAAPRVLEAAAQVLHRNDTPYTDATGLPALRQALSGWYAHHFQLDIDPARIVITAGASAALQLVCLALFDSGDEVLMPDPCYPCNRHFVAAAGATARLLPTTAAQRFQLDAASVAAAWTPATRGVLLASPSNPTGTSIEPAEMARIVQAVRARGGVTVVDEIYLGLSYVTRYATSALALGDDIVSVNSFSKYFGMTGWRLGWMVLPPGLVEAVERLAQNLYICPSTLAQKAALACFEPESLAEYQRRRSELGARRDLVLQGLHDIGLPVPVEPDGAFYAWADIGQHATDSWDFCHQLIHSAHVALTPGRDFGPANAQRHLRLSYATARPLLVEALARLQRQLHGVA
ncbi:MAG: pyridoxal phosphate-dependent aminotransferase [Rubrivivax sp.]|jgi:aspartate/methionine/tyrosine aminotransferase|nr:pyridoxal phosphate-dependent aminotransferase [Rubrivivax sp.]